MARAACGAALAVLAGVGALATGAAGQSSVYLSLGVREVDNPPVFLFQDGGTVGGIEWVNLDGQVLVLDNTWQRFTWTFATDPITPFAGASADGVLDTVAGGGTIEHLRIRNINAVGGPIDLYIDDLRYTHSSIGSDVLDFNDAAIPEYLFRHPEFSSSTSQYLVLDPLPFSRCEPDGEAHSPPNSAHIRFQFTDDPAAWLRLTTFNAAAWPNMFIYFWGGASVEFWIRGTGPLPPPCFCELTGDAPPRVDVFDLLAYLDLWFADVAGADLDGNGDVTVFDLLGYLDCWFMGC